MLIELHILQNFAPSNLNRDDTNTPKDCEFGGVRRARISSQCLKRAIRWSPSFRQSTQVDNGMRTRWITRKFIEELQKNGKSLEEAQVMANDFAFAFAGKMEKKNGVPYTAVLIYYSPEEINHLVEGLLSGRSAGDVAKEMVKISTGHTSAPDIALFGRMLANDPRLNLEAACQVAHAISTHRVSMEMDFYTAVDELNQEDETGAGMMGVTAFNSACFYRYSCVDWNKLVENLDGNADLAARTLEGFLRASVAAVPTGKQNSFAAQSMPSMLLAVVRENGQAFSLANAFETPVTAKREGGYVAASVEKMEAYWQSITQVFGNQGVKPFALAIDPCVELDVLKPNACKTMDSWVNEIKSAVQAS